MKDFQVGIAHLQDAPDCYVVAAVAWFNRQPDFNTHGMTLPYMKKVLPAVTFVNNTELAKTINVAATRIVEKLLVKELLVPQKPPQIELIVRPALRNQRFVLPHKPQAQHWLLNAAERALDAWLRGER